MGREIHLPFKEIQCRVNYTRAMSESLKIAKTPPHGVFEHMDGLIKFDFIIWTYKTMSPILGTNSVLSIDACIRSYERKHTFFKSIFYLRF